MTNLSSCPPRPFTEKRAELPTRLRKLRQKVITPGQRKRRNRSGGQIIPEEKRVILRSVNVAGPGQGRVALLPVLFHNARKGEALNIFVPENRIMQFVHVTDLARILERIIRMDRSGVYNATGTEAIEIRQLAEKVLELCRSSSKLLTSGEFEKTVTICGEKLRGETGMGAENAAGIDTGRTNEGDRYMKKVLVIASHFDR